MLSRRSYRVKVFQALYAAQENKSLTYRHIESNLKSWLNETPKLVAYNLFLVKKIGELILESKEKKENKYLPSESDKTFKTRFADNHTTIFLMENEYFESYIKDNHFEHKLDDEFLIYTYKMLLTSERYEKYLSSPEAEEKENYFGLLKWLFRKKLDKDEFYNEHLEEVYTAWLDDDFLIMTHLMNLLDKLPSEEILKNGLLIDKEETKVFALPLLHKTIEHSDDLMAKINPQLKNWDADRLATTDVILLKMALSEFLYFPSIPVKVTMNEYIDISKKYSTPKSKDFINGVLDRLMKQLKDTGEIVKKGRGLLN